MKDQKKPPKKAPGKVEDAKTIAEKHRKHSEEADRMAQEAVDNLNALSLSKKRPSS